MGDADLIACIYPVLHPKNNIAIDAIRANARHTPPRLPGSAQDAQCGPGERESTAPPEDSEPAPTYFYLPCIELRFSNIPRTRHGLLFGRDPKSDVVLPHRHVSFHQFTLTFDTEKRLVVKDWGSSYGVEVTYDNEGRGRRSNFQWILGGGEVPRQKESIIINLQDTVKFQVVTNYHNIASQAYSDNIRQFWEDMSIVPELFGGLGIARGPETELPTGAQTPSKGEIYLRKELGRGGFGVVTHLWNVSNGVEYALKEPLRYPWKAIWEKEARIMEQVSHVCNSLLPLPLRLTLLWQDHIVRLLSCSFIPHPQLHLEYAPMGSLAQQEHLSGDERVSILHQCLSALNYLHNERDPPIAHRDITPGNILVFQRSPEHIHVKLGDFGLSKDSEYYKTHCGSLLYTAPEINKNKPPNHTKQKRTPYTVGVDIWSLGVVIYELLCKLPPYEAAYLDSETDWANVVQAKFKADFSERPDGLRKFLLDAMVVVDFKSRWSTRQCLDRALLLADVAKREHSGSPTTSAHSNGSGNTVVRCSLPHPQGVAGDKNPLPRSPTPPNLPRGAGAFPRSATQHPGSRAIQKRLAASLVSPPKRIERSGGVDYGDEEEVAVDGVLELISQGGPK